MAIHPADCECDTYGCQLRRKGIDVLPSATPSRRTSGGAYPKPIRQPSWEKGRVTEKRPGGYEMPVLDSRGNPMSVHEAQSQRGRIRQGLRRIKQGK